MLIRNLNSISYLIMESQSYFLKEQNGGTADNEEKFVICYLTFFPFVLMYVSENEYPVHLFSGHSVHIFSKKSIEI